MATTMAKVSVVLILVLFFSAFALATDRAPIAKVTTSTPIPTKTSDPVIAKPVYTGSPSVPKVPVRAAIEPKSTPSKTTSSSSRVVPGITNIITKTPPITSSGGIISTSSTGSSSARSELPVAAQSSSAVDPRANAIATASVSLRGGSGSKDTTPPSVGGFIVVNNNTYLEGKVIHLQDYFVDVRTMSPSDSESGVYYCEFNFEYSPDDPNPLWIRVDTPGPGQVFSATQSYDYQTHGLKTIAYRCFDNVFNESALMLTQVYIDDKNPVALMCERYPDILASRLAASRSTASVSRISEFSSDSKAVAFTNDLVLKSASLSDTWGEPGFKAELLSALRLVSERSAYFEELADSDSAALLNASITKSEFDSLPGVLKLKVEEPVSMSGYLGVVYGDNEGGSESVSYIFSDSEGQLYNLILAGDTYSIKNGPVSISGVLLEGKLIAYASHVSSTSTRKVALAGQSPSVPYWDVLGTKKFAIILSKPAGSVKYPADNLDSIMAAVNNYYIENSYGQMSIDWDIYGWYDVSKTPSVSNPFAFAELISKADADIDYSQYYGVIIVDERVSFKGTPPMLLQTGDGKLSLSITWINPMFFRDGFDGTIAHELAHNFGAGHAYSVECGSGYFGDLTSCDYYAITDKFNIMTPEYAGQVGHFSSFFKERAGWLNGKIIEASSSGTYTIGAYELNNGSPVALKVPKLNALGAPDGYYYLEYRTLRGFDNDAYMKMQTVAGPQIRFAPEDWSTSLIPMSPATYPVDVALGKDMLFEDPFGATIKTVDVTNDSVTVEVYLLDEVCT